MKYFLKDISCQQIGKMNSPYKYYFAESFRVKHYLPLMAGGKRSKKDLKRKGDTESPAPGGHNDESMEVMGREEDWVPEAASKNVEDIPDAEEDEFGARDFRKDMELRVDHANRPLWVAPNGHIFLEVSLLML